MAASPPGPSAGLRPGDRFGAYVVDAKLGEGGMGEVFRARADDGHVVALKVLRPAVARDEGNARRFLREARAARSVRDDHLIEVLDVGDVGGRPFLAMTWVPGASLAERIAAEGGLPVPETVRLVAGVAAGLDALHAAGMVHRDVKPSNVLLDADRGAVLTDFGLVKHRDFSALTRPGQLLGTLAYLAPEALRGEELGPAGDLYGLGCVAFECLAGQPPFAGRGSFQLGFAHLSEIPPDPCANRPDAPAGLGDLVRVAMAKEPADRPVSCSAYARMLRMALGRA